MPAPCILIVEDDAHHRKTLHDILALKGYAPLSAASGRAALAAAQGQPPAAAVIDLKLADMSGLEVLRQLKALSPAIECLMVTGFASQASAIEAVNLGAYSYVQKPYDMEQLLTTLRRAIWPLIVSLARRRAACAGKVCKPSRRRSSSPPLPRKPVNACRAKEAFTKLKSAARMAKNASY